jgi:Ca2+-transporting ATPase
MGITGTEVAKSAAGIVITDDNFPTMVGAVAGGRLVYRNLKKVILYLFTTSVDEVLVLLLALLCGLPLPLLAVQILWINLVTEGVLTVNLVMEESHGREMDRPPVGRDERLVTTEMLKRMIGMVGASVVSVFGYYVWRLGSGVSLELVRSETFTVLAVSQWFNVLNCRSATDSAFDGTMVRNRWLLAGLVVGNLLQAAVIYSGPMNRLFHTVPIDFRHFVLIGLVASPVLWVEEVRKWLVRRRAAVGAV